jgi:hypothetical protein
MKTINFTYEDLFNLLRVIGTLSPYSVGSRTFLFSKICEKYNGQQWNLEYEDGISALIRSYAVNLNRKWSQYNRKISIFVKKHSIWLQREFILPTRIYESQICNNHAGCP